jgi:hypothetical protein
MRRFSFVLAFGAALAACSASSSVDAPSVRPSDLQPGTFVLAKVGTQTSAPFKTLDLLCTGSAGLSSSAANQYRVQQFLIGDTVVLSENGSARRAFALSQAINETMQPASYVSTPGEWDYFDSTNWYYFGEKRSLAVDQTTSKGSSQMYLRMDSPDTLSWVGTIGGGSCAGSSVQGQEVAWVYVRI